MRGQGISAGVSVMSIYADGWRGSHRGEVWLQVPDERPNGSNPRTEWHDRRDMKKLAGSFAEFMASLKPLT